MTWLKTLVAELLALFIDDGWFAAVIVLWVATQRLLPVDRLLPSTWRAPLLVVGLLGILLESVVRRAKR